MTMPELLRNRGRGPCGVSGSAANPDTAWAARQTPGTLGIEDAAAPAVRFDDLSDDELADVKAAIRLALRKIGEAKAEIARARKAPSPRVMSYFRIQGTSKADLEKLDLIHARYNTIAGALLGHANLVIDGELTGPAFGLGKLVGKDIPAYVRSLEPPDEGEEGVVKVVVPSFRSRSREAQARILIHEVSHRYCGTVDVEYTQGTVAALTADDAIRNADTYAAFAIPAPRSGGLKVKMKTPGPTAPPR